MDFTLNDEQQQIRAMVHDLCLERVEPRAAQIDESGEFPWDIKDLFAKQDILAIPFTPEYGGVSGSALTLLVAIEEISKVCVTSSLILSVQSLGSLPISLAGTGEQKRRYLPPLARGEQLAAFALTEPGSGSDAGGMRTRAIKRGDTYVLNGKKHWITGAGVSRLHLIFARVFDERGEELGADLPAADTDAPLGHAGGLHRVGRRVRDQLARQRHDEQRDHVRCDPRGPAGLQFRLRSTRAARRAGM